MAGTKKTTKQYPVKRGSRWDRLSLSVVKDWVIEGMNTLEGIEKSKGDDPIDPDLLTRSADYIMGHMDLETIEMYCRIVAYSDTNGSGGRAELTNNNSEVFTIPQINAAPTKLATAYYKWLKMGESEQVEIDERIIEANKPPAARHILPKEMLTKEEKTDPN